MKSYIIYVKGHEKSEQYANACLKSCLNSGFEAELLEGVTPDTIDQYDQYPEIEDGRATYFKKENTKKYLTKKSCFTNHVRVWEKCIELNEPVAFLEQDSYCVWNWDNIRFDELLILNIQSAFKQPVFDHIGYKPNFQLSKHVYNQSPLVYNKKNAWNESIMIPGTAAYAITPKGASRLLDNLATYGWDQSDYFINSHNVNMEYMMPEYFTFKFKNLNMSHGF